MSADKYETKWLDPIDDYATLSEEDRRLLLLLCHKDYKWRTEKKLARHSKSSLENVVKILDELRRKGVVSMSLNKKKKMIYGITNRVRS